MRIISLDCRAVYLNLQEQLSSSLAYSELHLAFACMFHYLDLQLYETTPDDMKWGDYFAPMTKGHLKVKVLSGTRLASDKAMA